MKKTILIFGSLIIAFLVLFQLSKYSLISGELRLEFILIAIAGSFFIIGLYFYRRFFQKEPTNHQEIDHQKIKLLEITEREYEVLQLISDGLSNKEIANKLFLTESTIKTHVSNILVKLDAKRRTQAIQIAKSLNIL